MMINNMAYEKILDVLHLTHVFEENLNDIKRANNSSIKKI
jgi:hypothetical protein